ncbi:MAG: hypothetical protein GY696_17755, partial [Gammaproteobacteria bacterium]|nr:hypothetical protein [Gammaproteobacteria bacterium]
PSVLRKEILGAAHVGHPGITRTIASVRKVFWWPSLGKQVEDMIRNCEPCQRSSKSKGGYTRRTDPSPGLWYMGSSGPCTSLDP